MTKSRLAIGVVVGLVAALLVAKFVLIEPERVLLAGDSILRQTGPALDDTFGREVSIANKAVNGSGLLTPDYVDWPRRLERLVAEDDPDVVVFLYIGNYTDTAFFVDSDGNEVVMNTPAFFAAWAEQSDRLMRVLEDAGSEADVYWVLPPPEFAEVNQTTTEGLRRVYTDLADRWPDVQLIDANDALADADGGYLAQVENRSGETVPLRVPDTVHLTEAGQRRLAQTIHSTIEPSL